MPDRPNDPGAPAPLPTPVYHILLALGDRDRHGYAIMQEVERRTDGEVTLLPGTLYSTLRKMLDQRLVVEVNAPPDETSPDERRRYYRITPHGRSVALAESERLARLLRFAFQQRLITGEAVSDISRDG